MKTIYLNFLILLIASTLSSSYLHAENYPSGSNTNNLEGQNSDDYQQANNTTQEPYPGVNNQTKATPKPQTLTTAQTQYAAMQAAHDALRQRATMQPIMQTPTMGATQSTPSSSTAIPPLPQFIQGTPGTVTARNSNTQPKHRSSNLAPSSNKKCRVVCGQYSNYTYATLISSIAQSSSIASTEMLQKVSKFTRGQIQSKAQCSADALTPYLSGKNKLYSHKRFFPGMPKPRLFYNVCKRQCSSGKGGIIFKKSNPVIIELVKQYDFTHGKKEDKTLALIAASGSGGFEDQATQPISGARMQSRPPQTGAMIAGG